jgi:hypothetical protein
VLARRSVSSTAPTVTLLEPNGGEEWDGAGEAMVRWLAEDADGGELAYWVEYSADGGESWQTLRRNVAESSLTVNLVNLEGSARALIRVLATDGVNTVADTSDSTFAVARKAPWVGIGTPAANTEVPAGSEVRFEGIALDQEDGMLSGAAMVWESDVDGMIGSGELLSGRLTTGTHRVTLTATDSDGQQANAEVVVVAR